ncbi:MAG: acyltransferase [Nostoc sp. GBBB01]|nr:acyltransferase [Nostoc sp. GBBB01]
MNINSHPLATTINSRSTYHSNILEIVKGLAILWIAWYHIDQLMLPANQQIFNIRTLASFGFAGVNVFILVSGFGLTFSMMNKMANNVSNSWISISWKDFYVRRLLRIYPLYIFVHILFFITGTLQGKYTDMPLDIGFLLSITGLRVFFPKYFWYGPDAFWFIGLIVQFYLLFPLLFWLLLKTKKANFLIISFAAYILFRLISSLSEYSYIYMLGLAPNRIVEFSLGMVLAYSLKEKNQTITDLFSNKKLIVIIFLLSILVGIFINYQPIEAIRIIASNCNLTIASFLGLTILALLTRYILPIYNFLVFVGSISYSFYLLHSPPIRPAFALFKSIGINNFFIMVFIYLAIIIFLSYLLTYLECFLLPPKRKA